MDAAHEEAEVARELRRVLAGISGGNADAAPRRHQRGVDPAADRAGSVVGVSVGAERDVHHRRDPPAVEPLSESEQILDRVREPRRVVQRGMARAIFLGERDQDARDRGVGADAELAGGDAGHVRAVGPRTLGRLAEQVRSPDPVRAAPLERPIHSLAR